MLAAVAFDEAKQILYLLPLRTLRQPPRRLTFHQDGLARTLTCYSVPGESMPSAKSDPNAGIFEYALRHLEKELDGVLGRIDQIRKELGIRVSGPVVTEPVSPAVVAPAEPAPRKKRVLSAAARKKIAAAQKLRWAKVRKAKAGKVSKAVK